MNLYRHRVSGKIYAFKGQAILEATGKTVVIYEELNTHEPTCWVRPHEEFFDGRFEEFFPDNMPLTVDAVHTQTGEVQELQLVVGGTLYAQTTINRKMDVMPIKTTYKPWTDRNGRR